MKITHGPEDYPSMGRYNYVQYTDDRGTDWMEYYEEDGSFHRFFNNSPTESWVEWEEVGPGTDYPDKEPLGAITQGQSAPPPIDAQELPPEDRYDDFEAPVLGDVQRLPPDDRYDQFEAPVSDDIRGMPSSSVTNSAAAANQYVTPETLENAGEYMAVDAELEKQRAEELERSQEKAPPEEPPPPPPETPPADPNVDRQPPEESPFPHGQVREMPDWNNIPPDLYEEPAPAPPAPDPGPLQSVDPALLDPGASGPTLDPSLFEPSAPGATIDPYFVDPNAPGPTIDPALLDPAAPGPTVDPATLDPAYAQPVAAPDPALADPSLADPSTAHVAPQDQGLEDF